MSYRLPPRGFSITQHLCPKAQPLPKASSERLQKFLRTLGLGPGVIGVLSKRGLGDLKRIEETIHGIVDSLLLFDVSIFDGSSNKVGVRLVRTVFKVGASSLPLVIKDWKQLTNFIYIKASSAHVAEAPVLRMGNCLAFLLLVPSVQQLLSNPKGITKRQLSSLSHLLSTRQLPSGDRKALEQAKVEFKELTSTPANVDENWIRELEESAERIGLDVATRIDVAGLKLDSHISLSHAGSLERTVDQGGRAAEIIDALNRTLTFSPPKEVCQLIANPWFTILGRPHSFVSDEYPDWTRLEEYLFEVTPVGDQRLLCPMGEERWRYWYRQPKDANDTFQSSVNDLVHKDPFGAQTVKTVMRRKDPDDNPAIGPRQEDQVYRAGFDHAIGNQIYAVAALEMEDHLLFEETIPIRFLSVPEPGYKTRIVTTGPFWVQTLGQPIGHVFRQCLENIPEAEAGLRRADQAWQFILRSYGLQTTDSLTLSSDLKNATDAIDPNLGVALLRGFARGLGLLESWAVQTVLRIVQTPRRTRCSFKEGNSYVSHEWTLRRGVLMGEPTTKSILTLLNLCCEEVARRNFLVTKSTGGFRDRVAQEPKALTPRPGWWVFAIGGDDHIAMGPEEYLDTITNNLRLSGCIISPTKHAKSSTFVLYCEKIIQVANVPGFTRELCSQINYRTEAYERSPMVDSVKVRLLSPCSKSIEVGNEKNVGIGKGKSLSGTLSYLNRDHFPWKWISMVRDRFFMRMGALFPSRYSGVYWHLLLPTKFGGLGLLIEEDLDVLWRKLPAPSRKLIYDVADEVADPEMVKDFSAFTSNTTYRGYPRTTLMERIRGELVPLILRKSEKRPWKELVKDNDLLGKTNFTIARALGEKGWLTEDRFQEMLLRPILFSGILGGSAKPSPYNTVSLKHRYAVLWDKYYTTADTEYLDDECPMGTDRLRDALFRNDTSYLYRRDSIPTVITSSDGSVKTIPWIDSISIGLPTLKVDASQFSIGASEISAVKEISSSIGSVKFATLSESTQGTLASLNVVMLKRVRTEGLDFIIEQSQAKKSKLDIPSLLAKGMKPGIDFIPTEPDDLALLERMGVPILSPEDVVEDDDLGFSFKILSEEDSPKETSSEEPTPPPSPKERKRRRHKRKRPKDGSSEDEKPRKRRHDKD